MFLKWIESLTPQVIHMAFFGDYCGIVGQFPFIIQPFNVSNYKITANVRLRIRLNDSIEFSDEIYHKCMGENCRQTENVFQVYEKHANPNQARKLQIKSAAHEG